MRKTLLFICAFIVFAQVYAQIPIKPALLVDETEVSMSGEKSFKIKTSNDSVFSYTTRRYGFRISRIGITQDEDKKHHIKYWQYTLYFKNELWNEVIKDLQTHFK